MKPISASAASALSGSLGTGGKVGGPSNASLGAINKPNVADTGKGAVTIGGNFGGDDKSRQIGTVNKPALTDANKPSTSGNPSALEGFKQNWNSGGTSAVKPGDEAGGLKGSNSIPVADSLDRGWLLRIWNNGKNMSPRYIFYRVLEIIKGLKII